MTSAIGNDVGQVQNESARVHRAAGAKARAAGGAPKAANCATPRRRSVEAASVGGSYEHADVHRTAYVLQLRPLIGRVRDAAAATLP